MHAWGIGRGGDADVRLRRFPGGSKRIVSLARGVRRGWNSVAAFSRSNPIRHDRCRVALSSLVTGFLGATGADRPMPASVRPVFVARLSGTGRNATFDDQPLAFRLDSR